MTAPFLVIWSFTPDSLLEGAGALVGDALVSIDGHEFRSVTEFTRLLSESLLRRSLLLRCGRVFVSSPPPFLHKGPPVDMRWR